MVRSQRCLMIKSWCLIGKQRRGAIKYSRDVGLGPLQGQANWFLSVSVAKTPLEIHTDSQILCRRTHPVQYALKRYQDETKRLYTVLETQLTTNGEYLVEDKYSVVDMSSECRLSTFYAASVLIVSGVSRCSRSSWDE